LAHLLLVFSSSRMILSLLVLALADRALVLFPTTGAHQEAVDQTIIAITAFSSLSTCWHFPSSKKILDASA
jgi:hypothetical protein